MKKRYLKPEMIAIQFGMVNGLLYGSPVKGNITDDPFSGNAGAPRRHKNDDDLDDEEDEEDW